LNNIIYYNKSYNLLNKYIHKNSTRISNIFILTDKNIFNKYKNVYFKKINYLLSNINIIYIKPGENQKKFNIIIKILNIMIKLYGDRNSLLINIGGGVITDIGGYVASIFKRGINFFNISTSLLAMIDASIGGKNGIDLEHIKNCIGTFYFPKSIIIDINFLNSLSIRNLKSGLIEIFKYGLIYDKSIFNYIINKYNNIIKLNYKYIYILIKKAINVKINIIKKDFKEKNLRKILNFGHTIGHAIESYFLNKHSLKLLHGEAIAYGIIYESWLSMKYFNFSYKQYNIILSFIKSNFLLKRSIIKNDLKILYKYMLYDKKNFNNIIYFSLIKNIGRYIINCKFKNSNIIKNTFKKVNIINIKNE